MPKHTPEQEIRFLKDRIAQLEKKLSKVLNLSEKGLSELTQAILSTQTDSSEHTFFTMKMDEVTRELRELDNH